MKLFTISTICVLVASIIHAIPGPLVPAPAVPAPALPAPALPAPIIEARQLSFPIASVILFGVNNVQISIQISNINVLVRITTAPDFNVTAILLLSIRLRPVNCTLSTPGGNNTTVTSSNPLVLVGPGQNFTGIFCQ